MLYHLPLTVFLLASPADALTPRHDGAAGVSPKPVASAMPALPALPVPRLSPGRVGSLLRLSRGTDWLWRLSPRVLATPERLEEAQLRPSAWRGLPRPDESLFTPQPVPSVVTLDRANSSDALAEDACLGWHAQSQANFQRLHLGWLTVDQAAVAALQPGRCNTTMGLDLARLGAKHVDK